jgi:hypothetical protein
VLIENYLTEGFTRKMVANLWTEFSAQNDEALATNGKECKTLDFLWWLQLSKWQKLSFLPNR